MQIKALKELLEDGNARRLLVFSMPDVIESQASLRVGTTGEIRSFRDAGSNLHLVEILKSQLDSEVVLSLQYVLPFCTCQYTLLPCCLQWY